MPGSLFAAIWLTPQQLLSKLTAVAALLDMAKLVSAIEKAAHLEQRKPLAGFEAYLLKQRSRRGRF
jgi:hypothetical protein